MRSGPWVDINILTFHLQSSVQSHVGPALARTSHWSLFQLFWYFFNTPKGAHPLQSSIEAVFLPNSNVLCNEDSPLSLSPFFVATLWGHVLFSSGCRLSFPSKFLCFLGTLPSLENVAEGIKNAPSAVQKQPIWMNTSAFSAWMRPVIQPSARFAYSSPWKGTWYGRVRGSCFTVNLTSFFFVVVQGWSCCSHGLSLEFMKAVKNRPHTTRWPKSTLTATITQNASCVRTPSMTAVL